MSENTPETAPAPSAPCPKVPRTLCCGIGAVLVVALALPFCFGGSSLSEDDDFMAFYDAKVDALKPVDKNLWRKFKWKRGSALKALLGADGGDADDAFFAAAVFGSSRELDYLVDKKGLKPTSFCLKRLARMGDAGKCVELMEKYGVKAEADTLAAAACGGSLELCRYLCEKQGMDAAKLANLVEILRTDEDELKKQAELIGVLTGRSVTPEQLAANQLEAVKFFIEKGAPITSPKAVKQLENFRNKAVVAFLREDIAAKLPPPAPEEKLDLSHIVEQPYDYNAFFAKMEAASDRDAYIEVMREMARLPEYRRYRVGETVLPKAIPFEELSASEASQATWWVGPSEVEIIPTEESVRFYNEEIYPRYNAFFRKIAKGGRIATCPVQIKEASGDDGTWTRRKYGALAMVAKTIDSAFGGKGSFKVVLEKLDETDFSKLTPGATVNCEVIVFDLPEAYKAVAQEQQTRYTDAEIKLILKDGATGQQLDKHISMDVDVDKAMHTNDRALVIRGFSAGIVRRTGDTFVKVRRKRDRTYWRDAEGKMPENLQFDVTLRDPHQLAVDADIERRKREAEQAFEQRKREEEQRRREEEERSPGYFDN